MAAHMMLLETHPSFRAAQMRLEGATSKRRDAGAAEQAKIVVIKTVVTWSTGLAENISMADIKELNQYLSEDFRATNLDKSQTPLPFKGLVSDARITFKLVKTTRTKTTVNGFSFDDKVKKASTGGIAPYQPKTHMNLWVCALTGGLLGYAQFPAARSTPAVVCNYLAFWHQ